MVSNGFGNGHCLGFGEEVEDLNFEDWKEGSRFVWIPNLASL